PLFTVVALVTCLLAHRAHGTRRQRLAVPATSRYTLRSALTAPTPTGPAPSEPSRARGESRGEMSEWLKEHAWKACVGETLPRVRIPLSPPNSLRFVWRSESASG